MTKTLAAGLVISAFLMCPQTYSVSFGQKQASNASPDQEAEGNPLRRRYQEGEKLTYHMKGSNEDWRYEIDAMGVVKKDAAGRYFERVCMV
jgi:hypothetical protein